MIWLLARTVVPQTTAMTPSSFSYTTWSTPAIASFFVQWSRSAQNWNSPGLSPVSAPRSKVTTIATLTGIGAAARDPVKARARRVQKSPPKRREKGSVMDPTLSTRDATKRS